MVPLEDNPAGFIFLVIQAVFTPLALIAVGFRLGARRFTGVSLEFSDHAIFIASLFVLGEAAAGWVGVLLGAAGLHAEVLNAEQLTIFHQTLFTEDICWMVANCFIKLSILHFLNSIFHRKPWFPRSIYPLMFLVALACVACIISRFLVCHPVAFTWNRSISGGVCVSQMPMSLGAAALSLAFDLVILVLPIPVIVGLQMRITRKVLLLGLFGMGAVICVISGLRIASIVAADVSDMPWSSVGPSQWSIIDNSLGVVSACLPLLTPLFAKSSIRNRRFEDPTFAHSPSSSVNEGRHGTRQHMSHRSGDMSSLAWGGANRSGHTDGTLLPPPARALQRGYERPRAYRGLGGPQERALGPPVAFNPRVFYPPALRNVLSHSGSVSSGRTASLFSSIPPSRSISQQQNSHESRAASRIGSIVSSRVGSRLGSRPRSRSGSRMERYSDDDEGHDLTSFVPMSEPVEERSKSRVAIISHGRRASGDMDDDAMYDSKGITVTTTWDIDVESLKSDELYENIEEEQGLERGDHGTPTYEPEEEEWH